MELNSQRETEYAARWLDVAHPGWFERVDLATFDIGSSSACVIGQAISPYTKRDWNAETDVIFGAESRGDHNANKHRLGFSSTVFASRYYAEFWIAEIQHRQASFAIPQASERSHVEDSAVDPVAANVALPVYARHVI